ncbi:hypothetical protein ACFY8C_34460 [Streptomyces flavochromogenes]|uniref:Uncharacterized protein n=1 Tax=Streptomyces flavochromogenes TaxID=68199 RepID=A0ABW6Y0W0_9ACTN|nr:hypothetical protein [Streptomyces flavochromogenes]
MTSTDESDEAIGSDEAILECARAARAELPRLIGPLAPERVRELDTRLAQLLAHPGAPGAADRILTVLQSEPEIHTWAAHFLETGLPPRHTERGIYQPLPGSGEAVPAVRYFCPEHDFAWYRAFLDESPPRCPTHGQPLVREDPPSC